MEILLKYFPDLNPSQLEQYVQLRSLVESWNQKINLVSRKDIEELPVHHILHSLGIAVHASFSPSQHVLDVGTGGGFPGLPLAIMYPDTRFTLIDSIGKKITAVKNMADELELENVQCLQLRAEDYKYRADHVVSRAVTNLERFFGWVKNNLAHKSHKGPGPGKGRENGSGLWYLKGGDLEEELRPFRGSKVYHLGDVFSEPYFESKKLVWISAKGLK